MQKTVARIVPVFLISGLSVQSASASTGHTNMKPARLELQRDSSPTDIATQIEEKDRSVAAGPTTVSYAEVKSAIEDPSGQANPGSSQNPPQHHRHLVRNVLIIFGACFVFALVAAVASK
ncbi:hypothetical protein [Terriglobus saanensis]|uniref:Uncharacterized protein n=1 Tax=Terriglobus saanensis (strain ATCC BAA-1853 / DSM 23119 / SP1PR4) TaxID=401053 RepID=E8V6D6_TERSS|nr:hypothetical protein [Terriglobus saanensis]ADV81601.1 hypothetical protein AciPR4_0768 [Terriglobus saanensis SP1PR4]